MEIETITYVFMPSSQEITYITTAASEGYQY